MKKSKLLIVAILLTLPFIYRGTVEVMADYFHDVNLTSVNGRPARLGVNVNIVETTGYQLNVDGKSQFQGSVSTPLGTNVASAGTLAPGTDGAVFQVTGTTTINTLDTTGYVAGDQITLCFNGSVTVTDSAARSGVYAPINLSGGNNLSATKNDILTLVLRRDIGAAATQSEWWEAARTVNAD